MKLTKKLLSLFLILAVLFSVSCSKKAACGEFSLTNPQSLATQVSLTPTLEWTKSANATNYTVTLSTKEDFSEGVIKQDNIKELKWTATALEQQTKYYWKVIAHGEGKSKESTQVFSFTTLSTVLGEFGLTSPSENAIGVERKPVLEWEACANAVKYSLLISKDEDFTEANTITKENISNTYASPDVTLHGLTTYYWKVIAVGADTDDNTKTSNDVFSFTTVDIIIDNFDDYDAASFELIYQPKSGESITAELSEENWIDADDQDMDNGKSIKISGSELADWGDLQVQGQMAQIDVSSYDGIAFWMYPKNVSAGLGMIVHIANGYYPNDCMANMEIKGKAPTLVKIPFSALTLRAENTIGSFNPSYITGLWFTFKNASLLGFDQGFKGTLPDFEIYFDEFVPYKDSTITEVTYEPAYYQTSLTIDFEDYADMDEVKADCQEGVTDKNSIISLSETGGYNDSKSLKFAAVTADNDTILKKFWNFTEYDYFEFFYNVPADEANFFLRLYLNTSTDYSHRAYLDFSSVKLSGSGFLRIPISQEYLSVGGGAVAADVTSANIKGLGFFVKQGSAEFYIDNISMSQASGLPVYETLYQTQSIRDIINTLAVGDYALTVEQSYSTGSHKTLFPVVNKKFTVSEIGTTTLTQADFEDEITLSNNYIYTIYNNDGEVVSLGKLTPSNSVTFDFNSVTDFSEVEAQCREGVTNPGSIASLSATNGFNNSPSLKFATAAADRDVIFKKLWNYPDFDYIEFYYNVPTGTSIFFLRLYLDINAAYSERAYLDFNNSSARLSGQGFVRIPISKDFLSAGGNATVDDIKSSKIKGLGFYVGNGSAEFYIDNIRLIKDEALPTAMELTDIATLRGAINTIPVGSGYRIVVEKAFSTGSHKALCPVVNSLFDVTAVGTTTLTAADLEDKITTGNYVCTLYSSDGNILAHGTITIS